MTRSEATPLRLTIEAVKTPIGDLFLVCDREGVLRADDFVDCEERLHRLLGRRLGRTGFRLASGTVPGTARTELAAYFAGDLAAIRRIELKTGGTEFQDLVWNALRAVPPGCPVSYARLALDLLGKPSAARAIGHANGANPFCIVIPCHRLVGAGGGLTGYSGGIERKRWLLEHEARHPIQSEHPGKLEPSPAGGETTGRGSPSPPSDRRERRPFGPSPGCGSQADGARPRMGISCARAARRPPPENGR